MRRQARDVNADVDVDVGGGIKGKEGHRRATECWCRLIQKEPQHEDPRRVFIVASLVVLVVPRAVERRAAVQ